MSLATCSKTLMALVIITGSIGENVCCLQITFLWYSIVSAETKLGQRPASQSRDETLNSCLVFPDQSKNSFHSFIKVVNYLQVVKPEAGGQEAFRQREERPVNVTQTL